MTKSASAKPSLLVDPVTRALSRLALSGLSRPLAAQLVDLGVDVADALVDALLVEVGEHDRHLEALDEEQRELAGHQAGADDADLGDLAGQRLVGRAGRALGPLLHEVEGVEPGAQLVAHEQVGERLVLGGEALVAGRGARGREQVERARTGAWRCAAGLDVGDGPWPRRSAASHVASSRSTSGRSTVTSPGQDARRPSAATPRGSRPARTARRRCRARRPAAPLSMRFWFSGFSMIDRERPSSAPTRLGSR